MVVDAHSKWVEAMVVSSTSSTAVITELRTLFARFGIPEMIVFDNGTGFTSQEFKDFVKANGIHVCKTCSICSVSPFHERPSRKSCSNSEVRFEESKEWFNGGQNC